MTTAPVNLTPEQIDQFRTLWNERRTVRRIAEHFGKSMGTISRWARDLGLAPRNRGRGSLDRVKADALARGIGVQLEWLCDRVGYGVVAKLIDYAERRK